VGDENIGAEKRQVRHHEKLEPIIGLDRAQRVEQPRR
jgi:hypothetical protein